MQRKISIYTCACTHACAWERIVPATLIIIKYPRSLLQLQKPEEVNVFVVCWFFFLNISAKINDTATLTGVIAWKLSAVLMLPPHATSQKKNKFWEITEPRFCFLQNTSHITVKVKTEYGLLGKELQEVLWEAMIRIQDSPSVSERWKNNKGNYD